MLFNDNYGSLCISFRAHTRGRKFTLESSYRCLLVDFLLYFNAFQIVRSKETDRQ